MESKQSDKPQEDNQDRAGTPKIYENKRKRRCSVTPNEDETPQKKTIAPTSTPLAAAAAAADTAAAEKNNATATTHLVNGVDGDIHNIDDVAVNSSHDLQDQYLLEEFCDEVLYEIFKFLDTWSLMALMNVCKRFQKFVLDKRLWKDIDLSQEPLPLGILEDMLERSHDKTHSIKLRGPSPSEHIEGEIQHFNKTFRNSFTTRCTKLITLELYGVTLDFKQISFKEFPTTLKRLVFKNCSVRADGQSALFTGIDTILINLQELAIESNSWFDPYNVLPISKLPLLRYLSLKGCRQMQEFIPYGSIAARHGFKMLEVLDLRDTPLNDSDLQCFNAVETLKEIYLQCPEETNAETGRISAIQSRVSSIINGGCGGSSASTAEAQENGKPSTSSVTLRGQSSQNASRGTAAATTTDSTDRPSTSNYVTLRNNSFNPSSLTLNDIEHSASSSSSSSSSPSPSSSSFSSSPSSQSPKSSGSLENSISPSTASPSTFSAAAASSSSAVNNDAGSARIVVPVVGANTPPRSRFLPRPDHIIYLDLRNRTSPNSVHIRHLRLPSHQNPHLPGQNQQSPPPAFDQMLRHNLFWDIINPLGRVAAGGGGGHDRLFGEENGGGGAGEFGANHLNLFSITSSALRPQSRGSVSDRGVCCFGRTRQPVQQGVIWIRLNNRPSENRFERFSVRDYKFVTDVSLQHLVQCSPHLIFLDVSGTSVTLDGVQRFKQLKPECKVVAEHLLDPTTTTTNSEITVS